MWKQKLRWALPSLEVSRGSSPYEVLVADPVVLRCLPGRGFAWMSSMFPRKVSARCRLGGHEDRDVEDSVTRCPSLAAKMSMKALNVPRMPR